MQEWIVPTVLGALTLASLVLAVVLLRLRATTARELRSAHAETASLRAQIEDIETRLAASPTARRPSSTPTTPSPHLGEDGPDPSAAPPTVDGAIERIDSAVFADLVLRESVVRRLPRATAYAAPWRPRPATGSGSRCGARSSAPASSGAPTSARPAATGRPRQRAGLTASAAESPQTLAASRSAGTPHEAGLWFVAGAGAGVYAMVRGRRAAEALTVDGLQRPAGAASSLGARLFRDEVAQGTAEQGNRVAGAASASCLMEDPSSRAVGTEPPAAPPPMRKAAPDGHRGDPPPVRRPLRAARPHGRALGVAAARRPQPAVRQRRHGAVQALLPRPGDAALRPRGQRAEVRAHARHRGRRQDHPARHVLRDVRQLLLRRLLQGRRHRARLGPGHQVRSPTAASGFEEDKL